MMEEVLLCVQHTRSWEEWGRFVSHFTAISVNSGEGLLWSGQLELMNLSAGKQTGYQV